MKFAKKFKVAAYFLRSIGRCSLVFTKLIGQLLLFGFESLNFLFENKVDALHLLVFKGESLDSIFYFCELLGIIFQLNFSGIILRGG